MTKFNYLRENYSRVVVKEKKSSTVAKRSKKIITEIILFAEEANTPRRQLRRFECPRQGQYFVHRRSRELYAPGIRVVDHRFHRSVMKCSVIEKKKDVVPLREVGQFQLGYSGFVVLLDYVCSRRKPGLNEELVSKGRRLILRNDFQIH